MSEPQRLGEILFDVIEDIFERSERYRREHGLPTLDEELKETLLKDRKEKAENVMIVDLVRNDFSRFAEVGSVVVEELFGIHTFPQVHQMQAFKLCPVNRGKPWICLAGFD